MSRKRNFSRESCAFLSRHFASGIRSFGPQISGGMKPGSRRFANFSTERKMFSTSATVFGEKRRSSLRTKSLADHSLIAVTGDIPKIGCRCVLSAFLYRANVDSLIAFCRHSSQSEEISEKSIKNSLLFGFNGVRLSDKKSYICKEKFYAKARPLRHLKFTVHILKRALRGLISKPIYLPAQGP